jgi:hypothetical protein
MMRLPIYWRIGATRLKIIADPPTMNVRVAARAPTTPPDMGASIYIPLSVLKRRFAICRDVVKSIVEQSIMSLSSHLIDLGDELIKVKTCFATAEFGRHVIITS